MLSPGADCVMGYGGSMSDKAIIVDTTLRDGGRSRAVAFVEPLAGQGSVSCFSLQEAGPLRAGEEIRDAGVRAV